MCQLLLGGAENTALGLPSWKLLVTRVVWVAWWGWETDWIGYKRMW